MRRAGFVGGFWPNPLQERLLATALMPDEAAREAWEALRPELDLNDVWDPEVHRILPLVHRSLVRLGLDDPDLPRLRGLARRTWYENQVRTSRVGPAVGLLEDAGIPTMVLKGMAIALAYYGDLSLRPMQDVDVLVPTSRTDDARRVLADHGWIKHQAAPSLSHGEGVSHPDGGSIDLHWHLGMPFVLAGHENSSEDDFWLAAEPLQMGHVSTRTLCPSDMLAHVCVHGAWSGGGSTVRWITDAMCVLRIAGDRIDWDRVVEQAERRRLTLLLAEPFRYLAAVFDAPIPDEVVARLTALPTTRRERVVHRRSTRDIAPRPVVGLLPLTVAQWSYKSAKWSRGRAARQLPLFLRDHWGLESAWELPREALRKTSRRIIQAGAGASRRDHAE